MVQNKETDGKVLTNGEIKLEENGTTPQSEKTNGFASDSEESDDDDYLDHLLMLPRLDVYSSDRNRHLVSKTLLDFCTAIENHKGYQKIKQELLVNCPQDECKQEPIEPHEEETPILNGTESPPLPAETSTAIEVSEEVAEVAEEDVVPEIRRQSIRLKKAQFGKVQATLVLTNLLTPHYILVPEHAPAINDQFFVCRRCTIFFRTRKLRKLHNITHHRRKLNGQVVAVDKAKQRLRRSLSNKEPFICDLCEKNFKQKALLRSHMNTHMTEPQFFCSLCPYASKRNNDLKKHHETHHNPDRVVKQRVRKRKCEKCDDVLDGKKAFKKHMREKHPPEKSLKKGRFKKSCTECEEILDGIKAFRVHMKQKHSATTDIRCETCHRKFKSNFRLKKHKAKYGKELCNSQIDITINNI